VEVRGGPAQEVPDGRQQLEASSVVGRDRSRSSEQSLGQVQHQLQRLLECLRVVGLPAQQIADLRRNPNHCQ
jgi:hypothetical protein